MRKHKPTPATIIASVALFFSLVGTGIAADHYLITSLSQIAPKVRHELRGERGPQGIPGIPGIPGTPGLNGNNGINGAPGAPGQDGMNGRNGVPNSVQTLICTVTQNGTTTLGSGSECTGAPDAITVYVPS